MVTCTWFHLACRSRWQWGCCLLGLIPGLVFGQPLTIPAYPTPEVLASWPDSPFLPEQDEETMISPQQPLPSMPRPTPRRALSSLDSLAREAEDQYEHGQKAAALLIWERILKIDPGHRRTLYDRATARMNARQYIEAEKTYTQLIRVDSPIRIYPEALFLTAWAHYRQFLNLDPVHGDHLARYLASGHPTYGKLARKLLQMARNKTTSIPLNGKLSIELFHQLAGSERSIVHFWAEWCDPCLAELSALFAFSREHPDVKSVVVAVESEKEWVDRRLNEIFAPYKGNKGVNIVFIFDGNRELWSRFVPVQDRSQLTVPRTVFLEGLRPVEYVASQVDWSRVDPATTWGPKE